MNGYSGKVESMVLAVYEGLPVSGGTVLIGCSTPDIGAYGSVRFDPCDSIEVKIFGWDRLIPGSVEEHTPAIAALLRNRFVFDGYDWVWRRSFTVPMVPVAAHLLALTLIDTWDVHPGSVAESLLATGTIPRACER